MRKSLLNLIGNMTVRMVCAILYTTMMIVFAQNAIMFDSDQRDDS